MEHGFSQSVFHPWPFYRRNVASLSDVNVTHAGAGELRTMLPAIGEVPVLRMFSGLCGRHLYTFLTLATISYTTNALDECEPAVIVWLEFRELWWNFVGHDFRVVIVAMPLT